MGKRGVTIPRTVIDDLRKASAGRSRRGPGESWTHGWAFEEYRRSPDAAIEVPEGRVTLTRAGVEAYERAVRWVISQPGADQWDPEDVWSVVATLVATLPDDETEQAQAIERSISL